MDNRGTNSSNNIIWYDIVNGQQKSTSTKYYMYVGSMFTVRNVYTNNKW